MVPEKVDCAYGDAIAMYREAGWPDPFPLPPGQKKPPPPGVTGAGGQSPTRQQVDEWARTRTDWNCGLRLPDGYVGIDVDHYETKTGAWTIAEIEERLQVALPPTIVSTSRDLPSGIRVYRHEPIPGLTIRSEAGAFVDIIRPSHRYITAWPSQHPSGGRYRWLHPDLTEAPDVPSINLVAELPFEWLAELRTDRDGSVGTDGCLFAFEPAVSRPAPRAPYRRPVRSRSTGTDLLALELGRIWLAPQGRRNIQLNTSAFRLGQALGEGQLEAADVVQELIAVGACISLEEREVVETIVSALSAGLTKPRRPTRRRPR